MLKYRSIKKYGDKLEQRLKDRFGKKTYYTPSEIRSTVYKCNFSPKFLPLGYILYLEKQDLIKTLSVEFPEVDYISYKEEILSFLDKKSYHGSIHKLNSII